jgi:hypothetical protein
MAESQEPSQPSKKRNQSSGYLRYSGLAIQLLVVIGFFGWLGFTIDRWLDIKFPAFMLLLGFTSFGAMMYQIYRSINRD